MHSLKAWVFDFDGTILDTERALLDAYAAVHQRHRLDCDREMLRHAAGSEFDFDPWHRFGTEVSRMELERMLAWQAEECYRRLPVMPGVREFIEDLRAEGLLLGVASNGRREHVEGHLKRVGLRDAFSILACREDVGAPKPAPDLYLRAVEGLGLRGRDAVAVEDSRTGVQAARSAGLLTVAVPNETTSGQDFSQADIVLTSLENLTPATVMDFLRRRVDS